MARGRDMNEDKTILDLCGGTGAWSQPYRDAGYDVQVIDHDLNVIDYEPPKDGVYGILAAPPCTMFSFARTTAKEPRDMEKGMEVVRACLEIIWKTRYDNELMFWALENPHGYLRQFLGKPPLTFNPCDYGDGYTKKTDLWGWFNLPKKNLVELTDQQARDCSINARALPPIPDGYNKPKFMKNVQAVRRSITPPGFAKAFYEANK